MARLAPEDWLEAARERGGQALAALQLPGRKSESWKYSRVGPLLEEGLLDAPAAAAPFAAPAPLDAAALQFVFVDGLLREAPALPEGCTLERCTTTAAGDERPFVVLAAALAAETVVLRIAAGTRVERPIEIVLLQNDAGRPCGANLHLRLEFGEGAEASLVERQLGTSMVFTNSVIEARLGANARLHHHRVALDAGDGRWLTALDVHLERDAHYGLHQALAGSVFRRSEIRIFLDGPGAHAEVGAATLTRDRGHLDTQMCLEHVAPHCTSNQTFRAIAGERSRTILNGRIHIHRDAQKTAAELSTKNLLLSAEAEIDAKPELEIYADDVTCAHGATVGQLDATSLFYLRSRGIDAASARTMLSFAFLAGVVGEFPLAAVRDAVRGDLETAFSARAQESNP
ncbi:MAG: Fe-S cluster assembly protein SufD [Pseudomonadales bacterium]|jgi:Fe-S cluster assembly protein SufD|nr:Fe-S cluster assembly protein SufD [Pseudomonadales bacterium]